ncbi:MAG: hypothetical protein BGO31_13950 [Bacteroidetes bacterium 43-16]|nr:MAG: hypothetical protein BGO31_13950 [Bacteroidetes bacterium 43-16]
MIEQLSPVLYTSDFAATIKCYTELLSFEQVSDPDMTGWALLRSGTVELMISAPNEHIPFPAAGFTGSFYFRVSDVDACWQRLKDQLKVCYPLENFAYGMREFAVYDNNGYLLQFGQAIP